MRLAAGAGYDRGAAEAWSLHDKRDGMASRVASRIPESREEVRHV